MAGSFSSLIFRFRMPALVGCRIALALAFALSLAGCASTAKKPAAEVTGQYAFWPQPPADPRIQFVRAFVYSTDITPHEQSGFDKLIFGSESERAVEINKPYGIEMRGGRIYVCDIRNVGLTILDLPKQQTRLVGTSGLHRLQNPVDVAVAPDGMIYVADKLRGVVVYDSSERYVTTFGHENFQPIGLAIDARGNRLYVCNMAGQNVEIMDRQTGKVLGTIGTVGDADGQFRLPLGIDVDLEGNIHVVDVMRCRLQKFSPDGRLLAAVGNMTDTAGNFVRPKHVAIDRDGQVFVVDAAFQNVQVFDKGYRLLTSFGAAGSFPGAMSLPAGICVSDGGLELFQDQVHPYFQPSRLVLVTNQFGENKVGVYALGQVRAGHTGQELAAARIEVTPGDRPPGETNPLSGLDALPVPDTLPPPVSTQPSAATQPQGTSGSQP
jgi:DNA-binding beta-propeller fold protein YncE